MSGFKNFLAGLFRGPTGSWDLGRIMGFKTITAYSGAFLYSVFDLHQVPDWSSLGIGYTAVMGGAAVLIGVKDISVAKANAINPPPTA